MIGSFILSLALFILASLCWGFIFSLDILRSGKRLFIISIFVSVILSIFASVFFMKGFIEFGSDLDILLTSTVFAIAFILSLVLGFVLNTNSSSIRMFEYFASILRNGDKKEDREEIIDEILDRTSETGQIDILERELIESVLKFNDKTVREVMVPRGDIVAIDIEEERRHFLHKVIEEGYSRLPVFRGSMDNIVGIIYAKDLLTMVENGTVIVLQDLLRPPYYVPVTKKISQLLREMQRDKIHLAVVVDEFGGTEGLVTLEDVLEEIVGEIQDEYDESLSEIVRDANGDVHVSGLITVNRFNELLGTEVPQGEDYDTVAGFVQKLAGKLPQKDEIYNHEEMFFIVEEVARHRIKRLRVSFKEHPSHDGSGGDDKNLDSSVDQNSLRGFQRESVEIIDSNANPKHDPSIKNKARVSSKKSRSGISSRRKTQPARKKRDKKS